MKTVIRALFFLSLGAAATLGCRARDDGAAALKGEGDGTCQASEIDSPFLSGSDAESLRFLNRTYPEMLQLQGQAEFSPDLGQGVLNGQVWSERIFGQRFVEYDRTALAVLVLKWMLNCNYEQMTKLQKGDAKLTEASFNRLASEGQRVIATSEALDAMLAFMSIHDLGKVETFAKAVGERTNVQTHDHDRVLLLALEHELKDLLPSYFRLAEPYRKLIYKGLSANFNMGQFIQGEGVAASLEGLRGLDQAALDFYMIHLLVDIAGVTGHVNGDGSVVMNEATYTNFDLGIKALQEVASGDLAKAYEGYFQKQATRFDLDEAAPSSIAAMRIAMMLRLTPDPNVTQALVHAVESRPTLLRELKTTGVGGQRAILLYYAPALLSNLAKTYDANPSNAAAMQAAVERGATLLDDAYAVVREAIDDKADGGVFTVNVRDLAEAAQDRTRAEALERRRLKLEIVSEDEARLTIAP